MTTLVVDELVSTLTQEFTVDLNRRYTIEGIRPYIYMHNAPSGTFTLSLKQSAVTLISKTFTSADIKTDLSTSNNYAHIWKTIVFDDPVQIKKGVYTLVLSSAGYTFSESSYLGWIKEFENIFNTTDGNETDYTDNPYSYQIFENKRQGL